MKKCLFTIFAFLMCTLLLTSFALAETDDEVQSALQDAGITDGVQLTCRGDTAVCFAEKDGVKMLIVLEKKDSAWQVVINNPTALLQDSDWPQLWLDSDNAVFWTYTLSDQTIVRYHSTRNADGTWSPVDQYYSDSGFGNDTHVWSTIWDDAHGGEIVRSFAIYDENDNDHGVNTVQYLPATWLADCVRLDSFDVSRFPTMLSDYNDFYACENDRFFREAAAIIMPEYTFIKGMLKKDAMHFLMEKPDGTRVYVICEYESHRAVNLIESLPLPAGTGLGFDNFTDSLRIDGRCVTIQLLNQSTAGLEYIYDDSAYAEESGGFLFFGYRTVWDSSTVPTQTILYGDHPWDDITQIDWSTLPHSLNEASAHMDSSRYAMVVNPNPEDRLHLREQNDKGSRSQGKYYTGTPVFVLHADGDWIQVMVGQITEGGQRGWMMKHYLTFGKAGQGLHLDTSAMPELSSRNEMLKVYNEPQIGTYTYHRGDTWKIIGIIGDKWYHVWFPGTGEFGFVLQDDLWEGNG